MSNNISPNQYDKHIPVWLKGSIGALAALILIPSISLISVVKFGGLEPIMQRWAEKQLEISKPVVQSNNNLAIQILELNNTMLQFKNDVTQSQKIMEKRLASVEDKLTIHSAQINSGLQELQKLQMWALEHSTDGKTNYEP